jgi:hypothetical protein
MNIEAIVFYILLIDAISANLMVQFGSEWYVRHFRFRRQRAGALLPGARPVGRLAPVQRRHPVLILTTLTARSSAAQAAEQTPPPHSARDTACHIRAGVHVRQLLRNSRFRMFGEEHPKHKNEIRRIFRRAQVNRRTNVRDNHLTYGTWAALQAKKVTR